MTRAKPDRYEVRREWTDDDYLFEFFVVDTLSDRVIVRHQTWENARNVADLRNL